MKKYIAIAALLAAGTACANAAVVLDEASLSSLTIITADETWGGDWDDGIGSENGTLITFGTSLGVGELSFSFTIGSEVGYFSSESECNLVSIVSDGVSAFTEADQPLDADKVGYGFFLSGDDLLFGRIDCPLDGTAPVLDTDSTAVTVVNGVYTGTEYTVSIDLNKKEESTITYSMWGNSQTVGVTGEGLNGNGFGSIRVGDADLLTGGTISNLAVSPLTIVPEPSAFGLLAGIGALALVASRRRRK